MTSPFENVCDEVDFSVQALEVEHQAVLFATAARALMPAYSRWCSAAGVVPQSRLLEDALGEVSDRTVGETAEAVPLEEIAAATPAGPTDVGPFTAAQDCWICVDLAVRASRASRAPVGSAWYMLEPVLQRETEALVDHYDAGSGTDDVEARVLSQPRVRQALEGLTATIAILAVTPESADVDSPLVASQMATILPRRLQ